MPYRTWDRVFRSTTRDKDKYVCLVKGMRYEYIHTSPASQGLSD